MRAPEYGSGSRPQRSGASVERCTFPVWNGGSLPRRRYGHYETSSHISLPPQIHFSITSRDMAAEAQLTPMMAQYRRIKSELPKDALLLFRLGDFYEMFFEDAQQGAQLLNVALTKRGVVPMCGIPFHAANG